ncbi:SIR2 family NAD-dependent protein deacylase [Desulfurobacterium thermolithotrophum]|uniref:SIR2 family NAD-dependent protein deacylase n=1 Tax=Desulfurobacterium thermolithotrophum TaxID=64160 RepID=UPI003984B39C
MKDIERLSEILKSFQSVAVLTGAGVSAESGIPTFRGKDGLWNKYDPTELATFEAFEEDPLRVWKWYLWRMKLIANAKPNHAHYAISEMERLFPDFLLITQNVDSLHDSLRRMLSSLEERGMRLSFSNTFLITSFKC